MDKDLHDQFGDITIESMGGGFMVKPANEDPAACGSCAGCN